MGVKGTAVATIAGHGVGVSSQTIKLFFGKNEMIKMVAGLEHPEIIVSCSITYNSSVYCPFGKLDFSCSHCSRVWQLCQRRLSNSHSTHYFFHASWLGNQQCCRNTGRTESRRQTTGTCRNSCQNNCKVQRCVNGNCYGFVSCSCRTAHKFSTETSVVQHKYAVQALRAISTAYILYGVSMLLMQAFNGAGDTRTPTWISLIGFWLIEIPMAWILAIHFDMEPLGVFIAIPVARGIIAFIYMYYFHKGKWKLMEIYLFSILNLYFTKLFRIFNFIGELKTIFWKKQ